MNLEKDENVIFVEEYLRSTGAFSPIPEKDLKKLLKGKNRGLITIYKKTGRYNLFIGAVLHLMFALEFFRIRASYTVCSCIVIILITALLISAGAASWHIAHRYLKKDTAAYLHSEKRSVMTKGLSGPTHL